MSKNDLEVRSDGVYFFDYATEKYYKVSDEPFRGPTSEYNELKRREAAERRDINQMRAANRIESAERYDREFEEQRQRAIAEKERKLQAEKEYNKAYWDARSRYFEKSRLWRFFHKSFRQTAEGLSTEELNNLYKGKK